MPQLILASKGRITNPFGAKNPPGAALPYHRGVDTGHGSGLDIFAPAAGIASARNAGTRLGTYGLYWWINHDDGTVSIVAHLARHVGGNRRVAQGEVIGVMGSTGTLAVHCHQEYIVNGVRVDPTRYLGGTAGGGWSPIGSDKRRERSWLG
jgi:murein DD-endopeptidase MepM/ murein hydrolase activator NlpD